MADGSALSGVTWVFFHGDMSGQLDYGYSFVTSWQCDLGKALHICEPLGSGSSVLVPRVAARTNFSLCVTVVLDAARLTSSLGHPQAELAPVCRSVLSLPV